MHSGHPSAGRSRCLFLISSVLFFLALPIPWAAAQAPGGFIEKADSTAIRPLWTASQIQAFLPLRGKFTFPAPYNTEGIRLTNASDCGGTDCVYSVGYSYWRNINNHRGSDTMLIFLGLQGVGPTLFSYNKVTDQVVKVGPLFDTTSPYSASSGEGWYFSATQPSKLYVTAPLSAQLQRYDVFTKAFETVFDATTQFGAGRYIWQTHSSDDDNVHSATLRDSATFANLGCFAYREDTRVFSYFPAQGDFDECQIDKSGRWLLIKENVDMIAGEDNVMIDLQTGSQRLLLDQNGAAGHSDNGYGYMVAEDNWYPLPGAVRVWNFDGSSPQGLLAYHSTSWSGGGVGHIAHSNALPGVPLSQQYACGGDPNTLLAPRTNEIFCFRLDTSLDVLVVTQVMTDMTATGGGDAYSKVPKGNLDVTGSYFIWVSNMGGSRADAFMVKVPGQLLTGTSPDTTPPTVSLTAPAAGSTLSGVVPVSAQASDAVGVVGVQIKLDGTPLGAEIAVSPYSISWDTATAANGAHSLTAVARDAAGNSATSTAVNVTVTNADTVPPIISSVSASGISSLGAIIAWTTNELADSQVEYGPTTSYGSSTTLATGLLIAHSQTLAGLTGGTLYHYRVKSRDAAGNPAVSGDFTFTTLQANAGLIDFLKLDEGTGTAAADSSGNGNAGTLTNGATWTAGTSGTGVALDGVSNYVSIAHAPMLDAFPLSVAIWFKTTTTAGVRGLANKYVAGSSNGYQIFFNNGSLCAWYLKDATNYVYDGGGCTMSTAGYNDGAWHQAALVVDALGGRLYVDGMQKASLPWTGVAGAPTTIQDVRLGHYPGAFGGAEYLPGTIDDFRLYGRALSDAEMLQLYNGSRPAPDTTPPVLSGVGVTSIGPTGATIVWTTNELADSQVDYGLTSAYGSSTTLNPSLVLAHSQALTGLTSATLYHYRVKSNDAAGNLATSSDFTFLTLDNIPPVISSVAATAITSSAATVTWTTNEQADSQVDYGLTSAYGSSTTLNTSLVLSHSQALTGLTSATLYHYRVKSKDAAGNLATSGDFTFTTASGADPTLIDYLKMDEGTGTTTADSSGYGNAGTLMNGAAWNPGTSGSAVTLDGVSTYVRIAHAAMLDAYPLSVAVWFKTTTTTGVGGLVNKYAAGSFNGYQLYFYNGSLCAWYMKDSSGYIYDGTNCTLSTAGYNDGAWHQAALVVDTSGAKLYVDGVQKASQAWTGVAGPATTTQEVRLGSYPGGSYLPATVDELRIYNRPLPAAEVLQVYNTSRPVVDTTPPVLSGVSATSIGATSATIVWTTNEQADSQVDYGLTSAYGSSTTLNTSLVLSHSQALTGLAPATLYHYRVKSKDAASNLATSGDFTFTTASGADPTLIDYLKMDEGTGTTTADSSGYGNAGTLMNGAAWNPGTSGSAVTLDGVSTYVRIAHAAMLDAYPLSVAVWFKTTTTTGVGGLVNKYAAGSFNGYQLYFYNGSLCAWYMKDSSGYIYDGTNCTLSTAGYNDGAWHQAALVVDTSGAKLYVDGVQKASQAWTGVAGPATTTQEVRLGSYPGGSYLPATVDELRIYNRPLSASEVTQLNAIR